MVRFLARPDTTMFSQIQLLRFQVNTPKTRRTHCRKCNCHSAHRVSQYKKTKERTTAQGRRRYDRKQLGFGGQTKPIFKKKVSFLVLASDYYKLTSFSIIGKDHQKDCASYGVQPLQGKTAEDDEALQNLSNGRREKTKRNDSVLS